ncbi:gamma-glutamylcyclotransferase [Alteromonas sp. CYL-A6]|uniref:gamma-glutamylcyclotransferase n=1 Tax=Alteromonas nitratireducens TaxID=3390813 RepID=UPI0034BFC13C
MHSDVLNHWFEQVTTPDLVLGYGSLMSADSRQRYSAIHVPGLPVHVSGFYRAWVTRSVSERQTYVGALPEVSARLNAQLIPTVIDPSLQDREKDYRFVQVSPDKLTSSLTREQHDTLVNWLDEKTVWICQTLDDQPADDTHPVSQTYIDTCLSGCLEHGGINEARQFIETTRGWSHPRINDRVTPRYPRAARVCPSLYERIDALLEAHEKAD